MTRESVALFTVVMALMLIGVLTVYSVTAAAPPAAGQTEPIDGLAPLLRHLPFVALGLFGLVFATRFDYHRFARPGLYRLIALVTLVMLVAVLIPGIGREVNGAQRWIHLAGFRFQPSELGKLALVILLAVKLSANQDDILSFFRGFLPAIGLTGLFAALVFLEGDLGGPVVMMAVAFLMIFMAGTRWIYVIASMILGACGVGYIAFTTPYRLNRLVSFVDPWQDAQLNGYQLIQSMTAFTRGSLLGQGPGASEQKLAYLPEAHTDFIFAVWGEEMGLIGTLLVVALFVAFLVLALRLSLSAPDLLGTLLAAGIATVISVQAAYNMGMTTGILPTKGLPLPFISYGGSALLINLTMIGILLNIGLQAVEPAPGRKLATAR